MWGAYEKVTVRRMRAAGTTNEGSTDGRVATLTLTDVNALVRVGDQSRHGFCPQLVTSRMEVNRSSVRSCRSGRVERVRIERSHSARVARAASTRAPLRRNCHCPTDCVWETGTDLRFDPNANGAQAVRF